MGLGCRLRVTVRAAAASLSLRLCHWQRDLLVDRRGHGRPTRHAARQFGAAAAAAAAASAAPECHHDSDDCWPAAADLGFRLTESGSETDSAAADSD
jgi:hypothetical protein